jgi:ubiquinone/menaquinone biosynthesis C-methylase UbiE
LRSLSFETTGLDSSPARLEQARSLDGGVYVEGDALALPFPDRAFDVTALITTLEFVAEPCPFGKPVISRGGGAVAD